MSIKREDIDSGRFTYTDPDIDVDGPRLPPIPPGGMPLSNKPLGKTLGWTVTHSFIIHETKWLTLREDEFTREGFGDGIYTYLELPGAVFIVPITSDNRVLLIRSYRFTVDTIGWEVPAGTLADCTDLTPAEAALKELAEETGATCHELKPLGQFYLGNGKSSELAHFFIALGTEQTTKPELEDFEDITEIKAFDFDQIADMRCSGEINDGDSMFALLLAQEHLRTAQR